LVSEYISRQVGVRDRILAVTEAAAGNATFPSHVARHFANLTAKVFEELGGNYSEVGKRLRMQTAEQPDDRSSQKMAPLQSLPSVLGLVGVDAGAIDRLKATMPPRFAQRRLNVVQEPTEARLVVQLLLQLTGAQLVSLYAKIEDRLPLLALASVGDDEYWAFAPWDSVVGGTIDNRKTVWIGDTKATSGHRPLLNQRASSTLCIFGHLTDTGPAAFNLDFSQPFSLGSQEISWLEGLAEALKSISGRFPTFSENEDTTTTGIDALETLITQAAIAHLSDEYDSEVDLLTRAIKLSPQGRVYEKRASAFWYSHRYDEALADLESLERASGTTFQVHFIRGQILSELGRAREAIKELNEVISTVGDENTLAAYARRARAYAYAQLGEWSMADDDMQRSLNIAPNNAWAYFTRAQIRELKGDLAHAKKDYLKSLNETNPKLNFPKRDIARKRVREL
jgi:Tetratricopeptide repeat